MLWYNIPIWTLRSKPVSIAFNLSTPASDTYHFRKHVHTLITLILVPGTITMWTRDPSTEHPV